MTPPAIDLQRATGDQQTILENLLELYAHDFSEFYEIDVGEDGRFGYPDVGLYFSDPHRYAFLIRVENKLAGFALVKKSSAVTSEQEVWDMAEFFVLRAYRRHRVGTAIAYHVFRQYPGPWEVRVLQSNQTGQAFWAKTIAGFTRQTIEPVIIDRGQKHRIVFPFDTSA